MCLTVCVFLVRGLGNSYLNKCPNISSAFVTSTVVFSPAAPSSSSSWIMWWIYLAFQDFFLKKAPFFFGGGRNVPRGCTVHLVWPRVANSNFCASASANISSTDSSSGSSGFRVQAPSTPSPPKCQGAEGGKPRLLEGEGPTKMQEEKMKQDYSFMQKYTLIF